MHTTDNRAVWYRAKATQCEQKAKEAQEWEVKKTYVDLAHEWHDLARRAEDNKW